MNLYLVQDYDRPIYIIAEDWQDAIKQWKKLIAEENEMLIEDVEEPQGINLLAEEENIIFPKVYKIIPATVAEKSKIN